MAKQGYRISAEIKEEIIKKIKHEGLSGRYPKIKTPFLSQLMIPHVAL
jgi:hypothetical protein